MDVRRRYPYRPASTARASRTFAESVPPVKKSQTGSSTLRASSGPAHTSVQDAERQDLEILAGRAWFPAGKAAAAFLLCERTFPGRAVAHPIFRPWQPFAAFASACDLAGQLSGSYPNSRSSCEQRQALAIFAAHWTAASRDGSSRTQKPPSNSLVCG